MSELEMKSTKGTNLNIRFLDLDLLKTITNKSIIYNNNFVKFIEEENHFSTKRL